MGYGKTHGKIGEKTVFIRFVRVCFVRFAKI